MTGIEGLELRARPQALLLDAGDTLIFFDGDAVADKARQHGVSLEGARVSAALHPAKRRYQARLRAGQGHGDLWIMLITEVLVGAGASEADARRLGPLLRQAQDEFNFWRRVPTGVPEALSRARKAGIRLGVISNSEGKLPELFARVGLEGLFEAVVDSHFEGVSKPDPELFRRAIDRLSLDPSRRVYAGDIPEVDVLGARRAGLHGVLVDAAGHYAAETPRWPRVRSVVDLCKVLIALPDERQ